MHKLVKRVLSAFVAVIMMAATCIPAFADSTKYTITAPSESSTVFTIFQIAHGTYQNGSFSDLVWGTNVLSTYTVGAAVSTDDANNLKNGQNLTNYIDLNSTPVGSISGTGAVKSISLDPGYYAIADKANGSFGVITLNNDTDITEKATVPKLSVKVLEDSNQKYQPIADGETSDTIMTQITGTVPSNLSDFPNYPYTFIIDLTNGVVQDPDGTLTVTVGDTAIPTSDYSVSTSDQGKKITLTITDLKKYSGLTKDSTVVVNMPVKLNENAVVEYPENNTTYNPNSDFNGVSAFIQYRRDPASDSTTQSKPDEAKIMTYAAVITKTNGDQTVLPGTQFVLYKMDGADKLYAVASEFATHTWIPQQGSTAVKTDITGYAVTGWTKTVGDATTFTADDNGRIMVKGLDGDQYYFHETLAFEGYALPKKDIMINYSTGFITTSHDGNETTNIYWTVKKDSDGNVIMKDGAPEKLSDVEWCSLPTGGSINYCALCGEMRLTVFNQTKASVSTGGMGTNMFYVIGGLMAVAGIVGIALSKKRQA